MTSHRRIRLTGWFVIIATIALGLLGYLQTLFDWHVSRLYTWLLLASFLLVSLVEVMLGRYKDARVAEDFYGAEITETFPRGSSFGRMHFFLDKANNKCVALTLTAAAIPNSVRLWEGGYVAPAFTFVVQNDVVVFRNSTFTSHEEYQNPGPIYSVRYYPRKSYTPTVFSAHNQTDPQSHHTAKVPKHT